uniref:Uncharacterized protein n=1 Tax=Rhipicephalus microplus TaxID=6941 RepID=A0A6G5AHJ6_RHIMP
MKTFLANAFAVVRLRRSKNFTSSAAIRMPPSVPLNHYLVFQKPTEQKRGLVLLFHASLFRRLACVEHSIFSK